MKQLLTALFCIITLAVSAQDKVKHFETGWYYMSADDATNVRKMYNSNEHFSISPGAIVTAKDFKSVTIGKDKDGEPTLTIELRTLAAKKWSTATDIADGKKLGFILNDKLIYCMSVYSVATNGQIVISSPLLDLKKLEKIKKELDKGIKEADAKRTSCPAYG